jgi:hypothetical protein
MTQTSNQPTHAPLSSNENFPTRRKRSGARSPMARSSASGSWRTISNPSSATAFASAPRPCPTGTASSTPASSSLDPASKLSYTWGTLGLESVVTWDAHRHRHWHPPAHGTLRLRPRSGPRLQGRDLRLAEVHRRLGKRRQRVVISDIERRPAYEASPQHIRSFAGFTSSLPSRYTATSIARSTNFRSTRHLPGMSSSLSWSLQDCGCGRVIEFVVSSQNDRSQYEATSGPQRRSRDIQHHRSH